MVFANNDIFWFSLAIVIIMITMIFCYFFYQKRRKISEIIIFIFAVIFLIIALFSPKILDQNSEINIQWWNVLFIVDLSTSMSVEDIDSNQFKKTRLDATKDAIIWFIQNNSHNKYGLYWFAGEALELLPFTQDLNLFQTILSWIDENNISVKWSDFNTLFENINVYTSQIEEATTFVIFSDAWDLQDLKISKNTLNILEEKSIEILFVSTGTEQWWVMIDWEDFYGRPTLKMYNGEVVVSKVDTSVVKNISKKYNWENISLTSYSDFENIYNKIIKNIKTSDMKINISQAKDISYIFIGLFLLFLFVFLALEKRKS